MNAVERRRLEAVLPFYVNGRADPQDRAFVDELLRQDPDAAAMLQWHRGLAEHVRMDVESAADSIGWAALAAKVRAGQQPAQAGARMTAPSPGGWRAWLLLDRWLPRPIQMPAFAALVLVVAVQGVLLARMGLDTAQDGELGAGRGVPPGLAGSAGVDVLKVNFKDETPEHELRLLLISAGATIIQGPGQLGDYVLSVPAERAAAARQELAASKWVNSIRQVNNPAAPTR